MKKIIEIIFLVALVGVLIFLFKDISVQHKNKNFACEKPITYSIALFDTNFDISEEDFLDAISEAETIWENSINKELFSYDENAGDLKINLIYDIRQETTSQLQKLISSVKDEKISYNQIKEKYESLNNQYEQEKSALTSKINEYEIEKNTYETEIKYWNKRGGISRETYSQLENKRLSLNAKFSEINQMQKKLNTTVNNINAIVPILNQLGSSLNMSVEKYNKVGEQLSGEFEGGDYQIGPDKFEINIYQFEDKDQLIILLAHELGHALGLGHLNNPKAIMYRLNNDMNDKITDGDIIALKNQCKIK